MKIAIKTFIAGAVIGCVVACSHMQNDLQKFYEDAQKAGQEAQEATEDKNNF